MRAVGLHDHDAHSQRWAFGLNRNFGSVSSVSRNFGLQETRTDRCERKTKTDEFGFGFVGAVFGFYRSLPAAPHESHLSTRTGCERVACLREWLVLDCWASICLLGHRRLLGFYFLVGPD